MNFYLTIMISEPIRLAIILLFNARCIIQRKIKKYLYFVFYHSSSFYTDKSRQNSYSI